MEIEEVQRILGISKQTVYMHIRRKNLHPVKTGGKWIFNGLEIYQFLMKRNSSGARYSPSNPPSETIVNNRVFSAKHIWMLVNKIERFQLRYEENQQYLPLYEFKDMLCGIFAESPKEEDEITGRQLNELMMFLEAREEVAYPEDKYIWERFSNYINEAFKDLDDEFNRNELYEDLMLDVVVELARSVI